MGEAAIIEAQKGAAARHAAGLIEPGMVVGLGSGTTAELAVQDVGRRVAAGLRLTGVATSRRTERLARDLGIPLADLDAVDHLDLTIDGADEIALDTFALIKGRGGALLREKIVAVASRREVIIADASKVVPRLGRRHPVPVEVVPFGWRHTGRALERLGARVTPREVPGDFYVTDGGNFILDCAFGPLDDPAALAAQLKALPGVVEHGLFIGLAHTIVVADVDGVKKYEARSTKYE
ncbi:MAG TPA: ribose-5-phosphate isomerase RpiA [Thermomicrobiales bacterium]|nr:ribose-5-phosphate isomerase RpiA [Thermomicrobiales bacterium]